MRTFGRFRAGNDFFFGEVRGEEVHVLSKPYWIDVKPTGDVKKLAQLVVDVGLSRRIDLEVAVEMKCSEEHRCFLSGPTNQDHVHWRFRGHALDIRETRFAEDVAQRRFAGHSTERVRAVLRDRGGSAQKCGDGVHQPRKRQGEVFGK